MNIKKTSFIVALILTLTANGYVYAQESITLTTYYPSPFGQYDRLRLAPRAALPPADCNGATLGLMYYDDGLNSLMICEDIGAGPQWNPAMGGGIWRRDAANEQVFLQNINDKVGIGTNDPSDKLEVIGMAAFYDPLDPDHSVKFGFSGLPSPGAGIILRTRDMVVNQTE